MKFSLTNLKDGYAGYINGKTTQDTFYKCIKNLLSKFEGQIISLIKLNSRRFLEKTCTFDNGSILIKFIFKKWMPLSVGKGEHYPFLQENKEKIERNLNFPYSLLCWPIGSWQLWFCLAYSKFWPSNPTLNFEEIVDQASSAEEFINKMTNYGLVSARGKVLLKHGLLYETFAVYNELTKVKFIGGIERLSVPW